MDESLTLYISLDGHDGCDGLQPVDDKKGHGPKRSVDGALKEIARLRDMGSLKGPVKVLVRGGRHFLEDPILFLPCRSWPVVFEAFPGEKPVFDGGVKLSGWKEESLNGVRVWTADVSDVLLTYGRFRQLFVDGVRATPSRFPKKGFLTIEDVPGLDPKLSLGGKSNWKSANFGQDYFKASEDGFDPSWSNPESLDVVVLHYWVMARLPVKSFDPATRLLRFACKSRMPLVDGEKFAKYYVENVLEALSEPGEWALDEAAGKLHYVPRDGEEIAKSEAVVPVVEQLMRFEGDPDKGEYVESATFRGISFEHADWRKPFNSVQSENEVPGAIELQGARFIRFENCSFERLGYYALRFGDGCCSNAVVGCEINDIGAGGIIANGSDAGGSLARRNVNNSYTDNHIHACGRVFKSACGIITMHSSGNLIAHNLIHDLYYSGVSCGWVWGYGDSSNSVVRYGDSVSRENRIEYNHIFDLGKGELSDMGGIYTLGVQPGTRISHNLIHDIERFRYGGWAIYPDEGSSHIVIESNVCYDLSSSPFHQHYGRENLVVNNIFAFGRDCVCALSAGRSRQTCYAHPGENFDLSIRFLRNIIVSDGVPCHATGYGNKFEERNIESDLNLFWDVSGKTPFHGKGKDEEGREHPEERWTMAQWKEAGFDMHSLVADPKFKDLAARDFRLAKDSPAFKLGFKEIDLSTVGPR